MVNLRKDINAVKGLDSNKNEVNHPWESDPNVDVAFASQVYLLRLPCCRDVPVHTS